ncbi:MAG: 1-acyl-sn-glycerol-3-phosphate acyltransferase [Anaerolineales bacterium]
MSALATLTDINLDDLVSSFGWEGRPLLARLLRALFRAPARRFARQMLDFDAAVGTRGLAEASRQTLGAFVREVRLFSDPLPAGPLLALSNHPGMTDTLALFAALNRPDLKIIALDRPFLKSLPNISKRLYFVVEDPSARMTLVRQVSAHLRSGDAILTFPAGRIEPDPAVYPGAAQSLSDWTDSVGVFIRLAPKTVILPVLVRGVIWERTARHPLTRFKKTKPEREKLAAALQLLAHVMLGVKPLSVIVQVGSPITTEVLGSKHTRAIHQAVLTEMKRLIENPPQGEGIRVS